MADYIITRTSPDELIHYGIKGQKWGIRRYQNEDGSLTAEGREQYSQRGYEARQMYKKGIISRKDYLKAMKTDNIIGKLDNVISFGVGRRAHEFVDRHEKGVKAAITALSVIGSLSAASTAIASGSLVKIGFSAMRLAFVKLQSKAISDIFYKVNRSVLDLGYNSKIVPKFKDFIPRSVETKDNKKE